jgi:PEP-CTERM motif
MSMFASHKLSYLLAATLLWLTQSAVASTTFLLDLRGQGIHEVNAWECYPSSCSYDDPRVQPVHFDWTGLVTLVTSSGVDGVYMDSDILSLSVDSQSNHIPDFDDPWRSSALTAVVSGGQIVSLYAYFEDSPVNLWLTGMTATYNQPDLHHVGRTNATAIVTNVPEPSTWALMALGLCAVAFAGRRRCTAE